MQKGKFVTALQFEQRPERTLEEALTRFRRAVDERGQRDRRRREHERFVTNRIAHGSAAAEAEQGEAA